MLLNERANYIAQDWIDAWNSRDLERVLGYYSRTAQHTSPRVIEFNDNASCTIKGIGKLRNYFQEGFALYPNIKFELLDIMVGVDTLSIRYRTKNKTVLEIMFFNEEGKVVRSYAYYES